MILDRNQRSEGNLNLDRRSFVVALLGPLGLSACTLHRVEQEGRSQRYGVIGTLNAVKGKRDERAAILLRGSRDMPGNLSYIVAHDPAEADTLWITEAWTDGEAHAASLSLPPVQAAIREGRPLGAGMERVAETAPVGGVGLSGA
jgi:quinol monooxygenase YgiN